MSVSRRTRTAAPVASRHDQRAAPSRPAPRWVPLAISAGLVLAIVAVYGQTRHFDFVQLDDPAYVTENPHVTGGLSVDGLVWAFTTVHAANWHPVTWLSHMADVSLAGLDAGRHHATNVLLHVVNSLLLFWLLRRLTGAVWPSAFVAAIFAVHPIHVESVAWIAERKDVLSACFMLLTLRAYAWYARRPGAGRYATVAGLFALGLLSKPMLVTVPFVLLLLDWWPLDRTAPGPAGPGVPWTRLVTEKIPLMALAAASSVVTIVAQQRGGAITTLAAMPLGERLTNAMVSYAAYAGALVWPANLAVDYEHPISTSPVFALAVAVVAIAISWLALRWARRRPYLAIGWCWYLGMLVPVIGLVQVGVEPMADRYMYLPSIGLSIAVAWGVAEYVSRSRWRQVAAGVAAALTVTACGVAAQRQVTYWRNNVALFTRATEVNQHVTAAEAHRALGGVLLAQKRYDEAIAHFEEVVRLDPNSARAFLDLGSALGQASRPAEAIAPLSTAVRLAPDSEAAHFALGFAFAAAGRKAEAAREFSEVLRLNPDNARARAALEVVRR